MEEIDPVEALNQAHKALKDFVQQNSAVISTLQKLSEQYNGARKIVENRVKSMSKETRTEQTMGLLTTKLSGGHSVNFDALEEIVTDEEFRTVVDISYKFRGKDGKEGILRRPVCEFTLWDIDTGEGLTSRVPGEAMDWGGDKAIWKAYTGAEKYFLMKPFLIPTCDDPDSEGVKKSRMAGVTQAENAAAESRKPVANDGPPNWSWFWTDAKKRFPEAELRKRLSEFFQCDATEKGNLTQDVKHQSQHVEIMKTLPKEQPKPTPGKLV